MTVYFTKDGFVNAISFSAGRSVARPASGDAREGRRQDRRPRPAPAKSGALP